MSSQQGGEPTERDFEAIVADHWVADSELGDLQAYVERGREFAKLEPKVLQIEFELAFDAWLVDLADNDAVQRFADACAEYQLRNREPPKRSAERRLARLGVRVIEALKHPANGIVKNLNELIIEKYRLSLRTRA